ncbi:MAG: DUF488 domain-containing protein [bacterium]
MNFDLTSSSGAGLIFTIGTSTRSKEDFISLLESNCISVVIDVRRFPTSRFEHFKKPEFERILEESGIRYFYMGDELGGYRKGGYEAYMKTEEFEQAVAQVASIASSARIAIVCAERLPWRCHRRFIASYLEKLGWKVIHIIEEQKQWKPKDP